MAIERKKRLVFVINSRGKKPRKAPSQPKQTRDGEPQGIQSVKHPEK